LTGADPAQPDLVDPVGHLAGDRLCTGGPGDVLLIITIPFGVAAFRLAAYVLWPFGRTVVRRPDAGAASAVGNVIWFLLIGLWMALAHVGLGILLCLTIIGIPLGVGNFKLALVALAPLGKEIVSTEDPRAAYGVVTF
jgi:uncharacterized membrane protein YccF (DUF307 family)